MQEVPEALARSTTRSSSFQSSVIILSVRGNNGSAQHVKKKGLVNQDAWESVAFTSATSRSR